MTASRKVWRSRGGVLTGIVAAVAAGGAITGGIVSGTFDNPDVNAPSVFLTAPAVAATVSGAAVTVSATCGDNVGCAGVQFKLDGSNLGTEDTSAPFSISWDTTGATNGAHTLSAVARDAASNTVTSTSRSVTVSTAASTATFFVAQAAAGANDGSSCANAKAVTFFNTSGNWGAGKSIAPGVVVGLCGTITTALTVEGSGTAGNPVTVQFQTGAKISLATCGCIDASASRSYVIIDGGSNGKIEATDNGVGLGHQSANRAIDMQTCSHCTVENLTIANIFVMTPQGSDPIDHTLSRAVSVDGTDFTFKNNTVHDVGWAIYDNNGTNSTIEGNDISNFDHGIALSGSGAGPVLIDNNHFHDTANWDCGGGCHHDGIHCFTVNGGNANHYTGGIYVYNNRFDGAVGSDMTGWEFLEGNTGPSATPCATATTPVYNFNNVFQSTDHVPTNNSFQSTTGQDFDYNNTVVGLTNTTGVLFDCCEGNTGVGAFENNVFSTADRYGSFTSADFSPFDYNVYANTGAGGGAAWGCNGSNTDTFATFQAACGEAHGQSVSDAKLNANGSPQAGSPVLAAGTNLTSLCTGLLVPLCFDINGNARPSVGAWTVGAYN